jgi:hypothetical protein
MNEGEETDEQNNKRLCKESFVSSPVGLVARSFLT